MKFRTEEKKPQVPDQKPDLRDTLEKIVEEDEPREINAANKNAQNGKPLIAKQDRTQILGPTSYNGMPIKGPETQEFINNIKTILEQIRSIQNQVLNYTGNEGTILDINKNPALRKNDLDEFKSADELSEEAFNSIEKMFKYKASDYDANEADEGIEEEEEGGEEQGDEEQEREEQEEEGGDEEDDVFDPILKDKKTQFGETSHYCPVSLHHNGILVPGNPEIQSKFREKVYRFQNEEAKNAFNENPEAYLPSGRKRIQVVR